MTCSANQWSFSMKWSTVLVWPRGFVTLARTCHANGAAVTTVTMHKLSTVALCLAFRPPPSPSVTPTPEAEE